MSQYYTEKNLFFWIRVSRNPNIQKMILFFGDLGNYHFFKEHTKFSVATPDTDSFWVLSNVGPTFTSKKEETKLLAITAAKDAGWVVVEETYQTQAFLYL